MKEKKNTFFVCIFLKKKEKWAQRGEKKKSICLGIADKANEKKTCLPICFASGMQMINIHVNGQLAQGCFYHTTLCDKKCFVPYEPKQHEKYYRNWNEFF